MEEKFIILIRFNSKEEGINYLSTSNIKFNFTDGTNNYDINGNNLNILEDFQVLSVDDIYINNVKIIINNILPGELFLEDNFIKYLKWYEFIKT